MSPTAEISSGTTVRDLVLGPAGDLEAAGEMAERLSADQRAESLPLHHRLPRSAYPLLDSRILTLAIGFLDEDVGHILLAAVARWQELLDAARDSLERPDDELTVVLGTPYRVCSTQYPYVRVLVDETEVARERFALEMSMELCQTSVAVRAGAIRSLSCDSCTVTVDLRVEHSPAALLHRTVTLPVRLSLPAPFPIPLPCQAPAHESAAATGD